MVGNSKILTVSYGTFSCTLEGFDEPFDTMKSISEYFRDLAAEDRYFGAEPPTPDAEMLHRIAEREIQRRVEARVQDNAIVLRQLADDASEDAPAKAPKADTAPAFDAAAALAAVEAESAESEASLPPREVQSQQAPRTPMASTPAPDAPADSIAAKLSRIRAVVAGGASAAALIDDQDADDIYAPDRALTSMFDDDEADAAIDEMSEAFAAEDAPIDHEAQTQALSAAFDTAEDEFTVPAAKTAEDLLFDEDDEEVAFTEEPVEEEEEDTFDLAALTRELRGEEDEAELGDEPLTDEAMAEAARGDAEDEAADEIAEMAEEAEADEIAEEAFEAEAEDIAETDAAAMDTAEVEDEVAEEEDEPVATAELAENARARVIRMRRDVDDAEEAEVVAEDDTDEDDQDEIADLQAGLGDTSLSPEDERELLEELAAMEDLTAMDGVDEADLDDDETADADEAFDDDDEDNAPIEYTESTEAALLQDWDADQKADASDAPEEMDATTAAIAAFAARALEEQDRADAEDQRNARREGEGRAILEHTPEEDDSVGRLMAETDREFSKDDGSRRRNAIQHLKAAVLARPEDDDPEAEADRVASVYRDDLERVVKPRRPETRDPQRTARRMPPLMLVSEQRVDMPAPEAAPSAPVRPRRVAGGSLAAQVAEDEEENTFDDDASNLFSNAASFAEYAETVGAVDLTDLLEAAAAYTAFVEGRPHFSRPQIMRAVADVQEDPTYSREDGLRSFGQLLRQGKIQKLKRGQFTVSENTRFKPPASMVGE